MKQPKDPSPPAVDAADDGPRDFVREIVARDLENGVHDRVVTRFPPEPNGYLHIGHSKSIVLNFGVAEELGGVCNLRFDDTNPFTEEAEYAEAIQRDVHWLGYDWGENLFFASDYFERMYQLAEGLIRDGKAYVDSLSEEEIREYRGTVTEPGRPSPYRERPVAENLDLFRRMRDGEFEDGAHVLRAKIDMAAKNMLMRDPLLYRIRRAHHYRTGDDWCIYPMYDYAHCLEDAFEGVTHSLCTLEFENNRELYDWVIENTAVEHRPRQYEFARLNLSYTVMSKRKLLELVKEEHVAGWDDPRMPTISGLRRRGYTPESIRNFAERVGVAKTHNVIDVALLEFSVRDDLNHKAPRVLCVKEPLRVVIENYPEGESEELDAPYWPHDVPKEGSRELPFGRVIYVDRDDFRKDPPEGFFRLAPGREVRLRYAYVVRCVGVVEDDDGEVVELRCTYDPETRGGDTPDGRKVRGTIHWVDAERSLPVELRLYDRLFEHESPDAQGADFRDHLNPHSLEVTEGSRIEPSVAGAEPGDRFQLERLGYFCVDPDSRPGALVLNRTVTLRDSWAKQRQRGKSHERRTTAAERAAKKAAEKERKRRESLEAADAEARPLTAEETARMERYRDRLGLAPQDARLLATERKLGEFFERAVEAHDNPRSVANWVVNELQRERKERPLAELPFGPAEVAELVALIDAGTISTKIAKEVFAVMLEEGGKPEEIVDRRELRQLTDESSLEPVVAEVLAAHPGKVEEYRGGKTALLGFFVGQVMKATSGRANPQLANELLRRRLDG